MSIIHIPLFEIKGEILVNSTSSEGTAPILVKAKNPNGTLLTDTSSAKWYFSDGGNYLAEFVTSPMGMCWSLDGNYVGDNSAGSEAIILTGFPGSWAEAKDPVTAYRLYIPEHYEDPDTHEWVNGHWSKWQKIETMHINLPEEFPPTMKLDQTDDGFTSLFIREWLPGDEEEETPIEPGICLVKNSTIIPLILRDSNGNEITFECEETKEIETGYYTIVEAPFAGIEIGDGNIYEMEGSLPINGTSVELKQYVYEIPDDLFAQIEREYPIPEPDEVPEEEEPVEQPEHDRYYDPDFPYGDKSAFRIWADSTYHTFTFRLLDVEQENATATIDWGDGETTTILSDKIYDNVSHRYSKAGFYTITIDNTLAAISIVGYNDMTKEMLRDVYQLGDAIEALFDECFKGAWIDKVEIPRNVTDISHRAFNDCIYLKEISFKGMKAPRLHDDGIFNTTMGSNVMYKNEMKLTLPYDAEGYEDEGSPWIDILVNQCGYHLEHAYFKQYVDVKKLEEEMVMNADIPDEGDDSDEIIPLTEKPCGEDNKFPEPDYELEGVDCEDYFSTIG